MKPENDSGALSHKSGTRKIVSAAGLGSTTSRLGEDKRPPCFTDSSRIQYAIVYGTSE
jgi:hypothetical protein